MGASVAVVFSIGACGSPQVPAFFVFGDSLVDHGNNNFLNSFAKANYLPYGVDFDGGPSGRFCNGRTIIDFLGSRLSVLLALVFHSFHLNPSRCTHELLMAITPCQKKDHNID